MLKLPRYLLKVINTQQYICTIVDDSELYIEIDIEKGKGYRLAEENRKNKIEKKLSSIKPSTLFIDSMFIPIKRVNYKIKLIHDTKGNIKESLNFEILTNGSITPKRSLQESLKVLLNLFYPLFLNPNFFEISDKVIKKLE
jgi:DNA-directed RNA polymerase subunit alpha